ncbi:FAD-binding oxidoreductase [Sphaerisporangium flaviroseum]|uniref:FAD-binding oxidoreductase n=1 Tax=Sphaerisporangium flaviroseum TaxID=509199 RepID=A0ABP7HMJ0_9ACTN
MTTVDERDTQIALPGDEAFESATQVFNLAAPARPAAAVTARNVQEIRAAIRYAESHRLSVRVHTTGHGSPTARPMHDAVLIRTRMEGGVDVDEARRVARVPAGTPWGAVVAATAPYGLTAPHGSAETVGVVGYLLRGGMSFYGRKVGVASNSVRAIELVTADGELRRVDATSDPELFWALRGGGGGFGVVTAIEIGLFPAARVITGAAFWTFAEAARLLSTWRRWTLDAPWEVTTSVRVMNLPPIPEIPAALTGGPVLCVDGVVLGETEDDLPAVQRHAEALLGPLRAVAEPVLDTWQSTTPSAVLEAHMDPSDPIAIHGDHMLLDEIGDEGAAEFLRVTGEGSGSPLIAAGLRQLGGAYSVPNPAGGALDHFDAHYAYSGAGVVDGPASVDEIARHCAVIRQALSPWDTGRTAPSFVEGYEQPQGHLGHEQMVAADRVRARVDPSGLFRDDISPNASAAG